MWHSTPKAAEGLLKNPAQEFRQNQNLRAAGSFAAAYACGPVCVGVYNAALAANDGATPMDAICIGIISGATSYISSQINSATPFSGTFTNSTANTLANESFKIGAQGLLQGASAYARGGSFEDAFASGATSAAMGSALSYVSGDGGGNNTDSFFGKVNRSVNSAVFDQDEVITNEAWIPESYSTGQTKRDELYGPANTRDIIAETLGL